MPDKKAVFDLAQCNCQNLRKTARAVSHFYDDMLSPAGVRITQFYILEIASETPGMTISELADKLELNRSTMSKNIRPLAKDGLIVIGRGAMDGRSKTVDVTERGKAVIKTALPLWLQAQCVYQDNNGQRGSFELRERLNALKVRS